MTTSFNLLGLAEPLQLALKAENYTTPTPIQLQAIPTLIRGRDLLGIAETGTGKTAAFALPLLHRLFINRSEPATPTAPRALVLAPTRELAGQIAERVNAYGRNLNMRTAVIFGGVNQSKQVNALRTGVDVLIATPGRLLDLCAQRHVRLDKVSMLVLDEADRMLDMGFIRDVRKIVGFCRKDRQTLLFSATMPPSIAKLAHDILRNPVRVDISPAKVAVERIEQRVYFVGAKDKRTVLTDLLKAPKMDRAIVFTRTKRGADKVCRHLVQAGLAANAIHGNKAQNARVRALDGFRRGKVRILVATDIAARGIDVPGVSHVINFELPNDPESYVHRVGRTGRAGAQGTALSLCDHNERPYLKTIERLMQESIEVAEHPLAMMADHVATRDFPSREATRKGNRRRKRSRNRGLRRTSPAAAKSSRKSVVLP
ncbi:MAG: DEAD/DEAH box helicase [Pseudomonadota bacterium]